jgi:hypothetical protein
MRGLGWRRCGPERLLRSTFLQHLPTVRHPPALNADSNLLRSAPPPQHAPGEVSEARNLASRMVFGVSDECRKLKRNLLKCLHLEDCMRTRIWYYCPFGARNSVDSPEALGSASSDPPRLLSATLLS